MNNMETFMYSDADSISIPMLCNYYDIENVYVHGENGYWNIIKLDDGNYYNVDCYLDDTGNELNYSSYEYFAFGSRVFNEKHIAYTSQNTGNTFLYDLPVTSELRYQTGDLLYLIKNTSTDYGYRDMDKRTNSEGRKQFYNHLMDDMIRLWGDYDIDFEPV